MNKPNEKKKCDTEICVSDGIKELMFFLLGVNMKLCSLKKNPYFIEKYVRVKWPGIFLKYLRKRRKRKKEGRKMGERGKGKN